MSEVRQLMLFASMVSHRLYRDYGLNAKDVPCFSHEVMGAWYCALHETPSSVGRVAFAIAVRHIAETKGK